MLAYNHLYEANNENSFPYGVVCRPLECEPPFPCVEITDKIPLQCSKCGAFDNCFNLRVNGEFMCCVCGTINTSFITYKSFTSNSVMVCPHMTQSTSFFLSENKPKPAISNETIIVVFMQPKEADESVGECLKGLWAKMAKEKFERKIAFFVQTEEGVHVTCSMGNQVHILTIPRELFNEDNFVLKDIINSNRIGFSNSVDIQTFITAMRDMLSIEKRLDKSESCYELLNHINGLENDIRLCLFSGELTTTTFKVDSELSTYKFPLHFVLLTSQCSEVNRLNKIVHQTGGSFHIWNLKQQQLDICFKDLFDRLLCIRTRGGDKLQFFTHETVKSQFLNEYYRPNVQIPSFNPFTHFHFSLTFSKVLTLNYFQLVYNDVLLKEGKAIPFMRIETIKVAHTKDTLKFFDSYPQALAISTAMQYSKEEIMQILPKTLKYYPPIQNHPLFKFLVKTFPLICSSALFSTDPLLCSLSRYLLLLHSPQYSHVVFNPPILIFPTLQSVQQKPQITPSLKELVQMNPHLVLYPCQRLLLVLYHPSIITNPNVPLRENIKKITHIIAAIDSYKTLNYDRPQRYIVYDFLLTDPILTNYIQ